MCRWLAYSGSPMLLDELLYKTEHSLIVQSLHSRLGAEETNGDGFGIGWYGEYETPALFKSVEPAWDDENQRDLALHIRSGLVFAHIRASSGTSVQQTNCHPFRHGRWLWMHNGLIREFHQLRRELMLEVAPELFADIRGTTDSEVFFFLARTLFYSTDIVELRKLHPEIELLRLVSDESRLIVSEPIGDLSGAWNEVPESTCIVIQPGEDELLPFGPEAVKAGTAR